jgi:8-oxo-dGTP diphosphatase
MEEDQVSNRFTLIAAAWIVLLKDDQVFLARRMNTGWEDGKYALAGGHLDGKERASAAAIREAKEELGVTIFPKDIEFFNVMHIVTNNERIQFAFVARRWEGEPAIQEPEKADAAGWFPLDNLPVDMSDVSREVLQCLKEGTVYEEYGWDQ